MSYLVFAAVAVVAVFAVLVGVAFKAGAEAGRCGELEDGAEDEDEDEDDSP